jgi:23S rRNA-/tRNA-specific pseudouridylate synthase
MRCEVTVCFSRSERYCYLFSNLAADTQPPYMLKTITKQVPEIARRAMGIKKADAILPLGYTILYKDEHIIAIDKKPSLDAKALLACKPEGTLLSP